MTFDRDNRPDTAGRATGNPASGEVVHVASDDRRRVLTGLLTGVDAGEHAYCRWSLSGRFGRSCASPTSVVLRRACADRSARRAK
jgi:hypothetical protein